MSTFLREEEGPTWQQLLEEGKTCLSDAGVTESGLDAWYLLEASFGIDQVHFLMDRTRRVNRQRLEKSYPVYRDYLEKGHHVFRFSIFSVIRSLWDWNLPWMRMS